MTELEKIVEEATKEAAILYLDEELTFKAGVTWALKHHPVVKKLEKKLSETRGQWVHSIHKDECLEALAEIKELLK